MRSIVGFRADGKSWVAHAEGRWGRLGVLEGTVDFRFEADDPEAVVHLSTGSHQAIPPQAPHLVILTGPVLLELELWGRP